MRVRPLELTLCSFIAAGSAVGGAGADTPERAVVVVAEDGGFAATTVRTVRSIAETELRKHGLLVREHAASEAPASESPASAETRAEGGPDAPRVFVVRLGRLDEKVPIALEERNPQGGVPLFVASHTADSIDEADLVLGRLVRAVLLREPFEAGARIATVTGKESEPFRKKPGEGLWMIGVGLEPQGLSFGWSHEAEYWRLGILAQGDEESGFFGVDGAWIPFTGNISPYVGAGLGIVGTDGSDDSSIGVKLELGAEFFRLHGVRLLAGVNAIIPFETHGGDAFNPGVYLRVGF